MKTIIKSTLGAGFFAEIKNLLTWIYKLVIYKGENSKNIIIDFSQEYFPYKNSKFKCEFNKILILKDNIEYQENLIIYDKKYSKKIFDNFLYYNQILVNNEEGFTPIHQFRLQNNDEKKKYLKILNKIFFNTFNINENIIKKVNNLYNNYNNYFIIGIHYRCATTHNCELAGTSETNFYKKINKIFDKIEKIILNKCKQYNYKIYLATDVKLIQDNFIKKYGENLIYNINNKYMMERPDDEYEPHFGFKLDINSIKNEKFMDYFHNNKPGLDGGIQLLIDCLFLSKCNYFIPSMSNLSDFVFIFNPNIEYSYYTEK
jgi:hypothetical protein